MCIKRITAAAIIISGILASNAAWASELTTLSDDTDSYYAIASDGGLYSIPYMDEENDENGYVNDIDTSALAPIKIADDAIAVSWNYFLKEDNSLWKWNRELNKAELVADGVKEMSGSGTHVLFIKEDGTLWGMGSNYKGQLAQGDMEYSVEEQKELIEQGNESKLLLMKCTPDYYSEPVMITDDVKSVAAGEQCSYILKNDGVLYRCGYLPYKDMSEDGSIRIMNNVPEKFAENIKEVFGGGMAGFAVENDGKDTLLRWGSSETDYIGTILEAEPVRYTDNVRAISFRPGFNYVLKNDDSLWRYDSTANAEETETAQKVAEDVSYVAGSVYGDGVRDRQMVLKNTGELYMMEFDAEGDEASFTKFKNNIRLSGTEPIVREYNDIGGLSDEEKTAVIRLSKAGIINGTSDDGFSPDKTVNRAEAAAMLLRMTGKKDSTDIPDFADVTSEDWYYNTAGASQKYSIVKGYEDNTFRGDENISALQLISLNARVLRNERNIEADYTYDIRDNVPEWCVDDVKLALREGLISETELRGFLKDDSITRAEAAVILYRLYDRI